MQTKKTRRAQRGVTRWRGLAVYFLLRAAVLGGAVPAQPADAMAGATQSEEATRARFLELRREIARHDELYFKKAAPVISDFEYDRLKAELHGLEARLGEQATETVGDDRQDKTATHRHLVPMLSLEKAYSDEEVAAFDARASERLGRAELVYRVEPKYDGIAISLTYERGRLARATTRGNGAEGDDITSVAPAVRGVKRSLRADPARPWPERVELRGEVFISFAEFERVNADQTAAGEAAFANPRNLAAGSIRLLNTEEAGARGLELVCHGIGAWEPAEGRPATLSELRERLNAWGLPVVAAGHVKTARGRAELIAATAALRDAGEAGGFPTDGVVVKLEAMADQDALGTGAAAPRWALARKFAPARAASRLRAITWQVGRTGVLTPVAELEPVELDGSTVTRATLHNADEIGRRDLRLGDRVFVEKAGEIIPAVVGVDPAARPAGSAAYEPPERCPSCEASLMRKEGRAALRCENAGCPARLARRIEHLVSEGALDVAGLGPGLVEELVARGTVSSPPQVFRLRTEDFRSVPGVGAKSAERLVAALAEARRRAGTDGARLLFALGWPGVGKEAARRLANEFDGLEAVAAADASTLRSAAGLGAATAETLAAYLASAEGRAERAAWAESGIGKSWSRADEKPSTAAGPLAGEIVVLTGTLRRWTRAEAAKRLMDAGAEVAAGVTRRTTLVVAGEEAGEKLARARELGVRVIDEAELARRLGE